jgi:hypothetical protein
MRLRDQTISCNLVGQHPLSAALAGASPPGGKKPFSQADETVLKQKLRSLDLPGKWGSIMWAIINTFYQEYCEARVEEIRRLEKNSLTWATAS